MTKPLLISKVLAELGEERDRARQAGDSEPEEIPKGSRWLSGCPGDPACKVCEGTGYLRLDLPVGHRYFGKIFLCECTQKRGSG